MRSSLRNGLIAIGTWFDVWILLSTGTGDGTVLQATVEALPGAVAFAVVYGYLELRRGD